MYRVEHPSIYLGSDGARTHALLVQDERIIALGDDALAASVERVVRPDGVCVLPGLIDSHIHLWGLGLRAGTVDLRDAKSTQDVYGKLALAKPIGGWILGRDWDQNIWTDQRSLDVDVLDELFPTTPMCLRRVDGHAFWVNSVALRAAGITASWTPPPGGDAWRVGGRLNGCLVDDAMKPIDQILPPETELDDRATYLESARMLRALGITGAHKAWMPVDRLHMLERLRDGDGLGLRLHVLFDCQDAHLADILTRGPWADDWISARGIKFFADGAMGSRGAALHQRYKDVDHRGLVVETPDTMNARIPEYAEAGWQVAVHAIGDRAASNALDAFSRVSQEARRATRPRLEHAQMLIDADVARCGELGIIAAIQPIHLHSDAAWLDEALTQTQLSELFRWRDLDEVTRLSGGSDFPIEDPNPWHGISVAMTRRFRGSGESGFNIKQRLERRRALALYLEDAAWAGFAEERQGQLRRGFFADWASVDTDPFTASPEEIWDTKCVQLSQTPS